ncbi:hypothetical protein BJ878DRAFT_409261, partial [Calycina marina]
GARRVAEPTGDIKLRLSKANTFFMNGDFIDAIEVVADIVRINAETLEAWTMLASCWSELGEGLKSAHACLRAAQLRPTIADGWITAAERFEEAGDIHGADHCYRSCASRIKNAELARRGKARMQVQRGQYKGAIGEFKKILELKPHDLESVRGLVFCHNHHRNQEVIATLLQKMFDHYTQVDDLPELMPDWNDLVNLIKAYQHLDRHHEAIQALTKFSRWFVGRADDFSFDGVDDDCEWDADDDDERREELYDYEKYDGYPLYGDALPLQLRVMLGESRFRIGNHDEAIRHFEWLDPADETGECRVDDYQDNYLEVANLLFEGELPQRALAFYSPLRQATEDDAFVCLHIARCFRMIGVTFKAEQYYAKAIDLDGHNVEARVELSDLLMKRGEEEKAGRYILEADRLKKGPTRERRKRKRDAKKELQLQANTIEVSKARMKRAVKARTSRKRVQAQPLQSEEERAAAEENYLRECYAMYLEDRDGMRNGDGASLERWADAARTLVEDFKSFRPFYPQLGLGTDIPIGHNSFQYNKMIANELLPENWRGIDFNSWLDIFLEYALYLARIGEKNESYDICDAALNSTVYKSSAEDTFLIRLVWCTCALFAADETACYRLSLLLMKDEDFVSDAYRMFSAVNAMCHSPLSWYMGGPSKKYIRRQIGLMDKLVKSSTGPSGEFTDARLDIALLMLYGHIMYTSESYDLALDYFRRAFTLDESNALIALSIGLIYIHLCLNRRTNNQPGMLLQGTTFIFHYHALRTKSSHRDERQEAHYNVARVYDLLGMGCEALMYYHKVLDEAKAGEESDDGGEKVMACARDAAYNLQVMYLNVGNEMLARAITERWLVL